MRPPRFTFNGTGDRYQYSYPPPQPSMAAQMGPIKHAHYGRENWPDLIRARNAATVAEIEDAAAKAEAKRLEQEKREAAEIEALKERDRQFKRERGWPA
jgi:hypothetical protein